MGLREEAKTCNDCMCWHKHCHSECCKLFTISNARKFKPVKGKKLFFPIRLNVNRQKYYELHGCKYKHGLLIIPINEFVWVGDDLEVWNTCAWLTSTGLCGDYEHRPELCSRFNNSTKNDKDIYLTPNCLFRYKEE